MLVLSRKQGEEIQIGPEITLKVIAIHGSRVLLGVQAPQSVVIDRGEVAGAKVEAADAERQRQRNALRERVMRRRQVAVA